MTGVTGEILLCVQRKALAAECELARSETRTPSDLQHETSISRHPFKRCACRESFLTQIYTSNAYTAALDTTRPDPFGWAWNNRVGHPSNSGPGKYLADSGYFEPIADSRVCGGLLGQNSAVVLAASLFLLTAML